MTQFELHTSQIQLAADAQWNASPRSDEILLKGKTMPRLIQLRMHW
ncbi:hypothetical protein SynNOUM97013_02927 [Synechococcus sp. NOUM97013]|nr:hypothetical protein SynNOUM97013_02927 [Synechococcus sp. NOUM97013]